MATTRRRLRHSLSNELHKKGGLMLGIVHFSVLPKVRWPVLYYSLWAAFVVVMDKWYHMPMVSVGASSVVATLSLILSLLVSFRSSSSYDRWYEGRRVWAQIQATSRSMLRILVFSLPPPNPNSESSSKQTEAINEMCALICAFSYATMYHLRDEPGIHHGELQSLLPTSLLDAYSSTPKGLRRNPSADGPRVHHSTASETARAIEGLNLSPDPARMFPFALPSGEPSNLPLSLIRAIHGFLNAFHATPMASSVAPNPASPALDGPTYAAGLNAIKEFSDQLTSLERIRDTPIPLILNIHLQFLLIVFVGSIPLQGVRSLGAWSILVTAVGCAVFYGVDRAAAELSDPFGIEPNDLPISKYCASIHREYLELVGQGSLSGSDGNDWFPPSLARKAS